MKLNRYDDHVTYAHQADLERPDFEEFYPLKRQSQSMFQDIRNDPARGFYCLDWEEEELKIYGEDIEKKWSKKPAGKCIILT